MAPLSIRSHHHHRDSQPRRASLLVFGFRLRRTARVLPTLDQLFSWRSSLSPSEARQSGYEVDVSVVFRASNDTGGACFQDMQEYEPALGIGIVYLIVERAETCCVEKNLTT